MKLGYCHVARLRGVAMIAWIIINEDYNYDQSVIKDRLEILYNN